MKMIMLPALVLTVFLSLPVMQANSHETGEWSLKECYSTHVNFDVFVTEADKDAQFSVKVYKLWKGENYTKDNWDSKLDETTMSTKPIDDEVSGSISLKDGRNIPYTSHAVIHVPFRRFYQNSDHHRSDDPQYYDKNVDCRQHNSKSQHFHYEIYKEGKKLGLITGNYLEKYDGKGLFYFEDKLWINEGKDVYITNTTLLGVSVFK